MSLRLGRKLLRPVCGQISGFNQASRRFHPFIQQVTAFSTESDKRGDAAREGNKAAVGKKQPKDVTIEDTNQEVLNTVYVEDNEVMQCAVDRN